MPDELNMEMPRTTVPDPSRNSRPMDFNEESSPSAGEDPSTGTAGFVPVLSKSGGPPGYQADPETRLEPLLEESSTDGFRERWTVIQGKFVDSPRDSVKEADSLVAQLMQQLATSFADERGRLEDQWDRDGDVPTEDLRVALQHYRSFFQRLLAA